jgi:pyridoxine/pyridoxamine 5'-phosphate oxidase
MKIASLRTEYKREALDETRVDIDPLRQFARRLDEAVKAEMREPDA